MHFYTNVVGTLISITLCFIRAASSTLRFSPATDLILEGRPSSVLIYISAQLFSFGRVRGGGIAEAHQSALFDHFTGQACGIAHIGFGAQFRCQSEALVELRGVQNSSVPYGAFEFASDECAIGESRAGPIRTLEIAFDKRADLELGHASIIAQV